MTIFRKNLITLSLTALGLSSVLVISVLVFMNSLYYEINAAGLRNTARLIFLLIGEKRITDYFEAGPADFFPGGAPLNADVFVPQAGDEAYRLTLIDRAGSVLWDSLAEGTLVNHLDREEVQAALEGREGASRRNSLSTGMRQIYSALPVFDAGGGVAGVFRLSLTTPSFWRRISAAALPFLLFACLLALAAFAAIFVFSGSLSASLKRLVDIAAAAAIEPHAPAEKIPVAGEVVEFASLEKALRGMAAELNLRLEQARAEGGRLEAILNGMSEAVLAMDGSLILHLVNPPARKIFSLGGGDVRRLSLLEATRSTELEQAARTAFAEGRPLEMELKLHRGQEQRFHVYAVPLGASAAAGKNETPGGAVLVMTDITRLVRLEQVRKDFVANVSHELRTPIQLIKGFSETLLDSPPEDTGQIRRFIGIIRKNAETMENLTNDLLTLASLENGGGSRPDMEEQRLAPLFAESVSSVEPGARRKHSEIMVDCPADLKAKLYGPFIIQALINLLDNGIKYSAENSKVWAAAYRENETLVLEVRDQGIGIPPEHLERIFERFYRVDRARSREAGGTGLGLAIVRHIALLHNGTTEVESRAGSGSVFRIRIPQEPAAPC
ncbi:MAG: hypothetical protein LBG57_07130 [Treponema sp.]|jgi:two-component system phosphate regulon sensor histidine kinase PhoR|nr:hypothetical protein [Treponema sp.]